MSAIVGELTADGSQIVLMATGPAEDVAYLAKHLQTLTPLIKPSDPPGALVLPASWPAVVQMAETFAEKWQPGPNLRAWLAQRVLERAASGLGELAVTPPAGRIPRPYQVEGARMIAATGHALITDEPGTGKTITTILGLVDRDAAGAAVLPILIIAPTSVVDPWVKAFQDWAPQWRTVAWHGSPKRRHKLAGTADVYVTSYGTVARDAPKRGAAPLVNLGAGTVVADECHLIKSPHAERSHAVRRVATKAGNFVALSGTPITHSPADLWPTLVCMEPAAWPSRERWVNRYCVTSVGDYKDEVLGLNRGNEPEFRTTLLGQHRRVAKADVLQQLPPKIYSQRIVALPPEYRTAYDSMAKDMIAQLPDGTELSVMSVLAQLTRLSQLASAAADVHVEMREGADGEMRDHYTVTLRAPSWKVDALLEVLAERPGSPVGAFAPSRQLMTLAGAQAEQAGYRVGYVIGGQTKTERTENVEKFQRGELDLICCTTGAGGVGLTLTAANTCVFLQRPWSIVESIQAEDRFHRIGSEIHDSIEIVDIVAAKTIDTKIRSALYEKAGQLSELLQDPRIVLELLGGKPSPSTEKSAA